MRKTLGKKGNLEDVPTSLIYLFFVVLVVIIGLIILNQFKTSFVSLDVTSTATEATDAVTKMDNTLYVAWDYGIVLLLLGFILFSMLAARFIPSSPVFIIVGVLYLCLVPFIAIIIGNLYDEMVLKSVLIAGFDTKMPLVAYIMDHLLIISIVYSALVSIILYSRREEQ